MTELREKIAREICSALGGGVCDCPGLTGYEEDADRILAIPRIRKALKYYDAMGGSLPDNQS